MAADSRMLLEAVASRSLGAQVAAGGKLRVESGASSNTQPRDFGWRDAMDLFVK